MEDVRSKTEVSLDDFIETFVPNLPEHLELTHVLRRMNDIGAWKVFSSPPAITPMSEDKTFKQLTRLFDEMVKAAQFAWMSMGTKCPKQRWNLVTEPTITPNTNERPTSIKPDALFHRTEDSDSKSFTFYDIAFTAQFKKLGGKANTLEVSPASCIFVHPSKLFPEHIKGNLRNETDHGSRCSPAFYIWHYNREHIPRSVVHQSLNAYRQQAS